MERLEELELEIRGDIVGVLKIMNGLVERKPEDLLVASLNT